MASPAWTKMAFESGLASTVTCSERDSYTITLLQ